MPKVSIIVPVYKVEGFLNRCVDNILAQSYTDFELLLIDDGSPDRCGEICDEYAKQDSRVRVFHKKNGGVSSARNLALENAKGEWVCFIDSDDYWASNDFLNLLNKVDDNVDIVHFGYTLETKSKKLIQTSKFDDEQLVETSRFLQKGIFSSCAWSYFFSNKHLQKHKIRFNESVKYSEDREFIIKNILLSNKEIQLLSNCDYVYTYNVSAATKTKRDFKHCLDDLVVLKNIYDFIHKQRIRVAPAANLFISFLMLDSFMLTISLTYKLSDIGIITQCRNNLKAISAEYPTIDHNFPRYNCFMRFPVLTMLYYNIRQEVKNIIQKIKF